MIKHNIKYGHPSVKGFPPLNYILCWDVECESLYRTFLQYPQGDDSSLDASAALAKLDKKGIDSLKQFGVTMFE